MTIVLSILMLLVMATATFFIVKHRHNRRQIASYSITPEELHSCLEADPRPLVFDVRLPLDLLADPTIIPAARRIAPSELEANPDLIPRDQDIVVYCTCPGDVTSRLVIRKARQEQFTRIKFLRGGLAAWKASGYPVDPYDQPFHLDTGSGPSLLH